MRCCIAMAWSTQGYDLLEEGDLQRGIQRLHCSASSAKIEPTGGAKISISARMLRSNYLVTAPIVSLVAPPFAASKRQVS